MIQDDGDAPQGAAREQAEQGASTGRVAIVVPVLPRHLRADSDDDSFQRPRLTRSAEARLDEAVGLARAINLTPLVTEIINISDPRPATLLGSGRVADLAQAVADLKIDLVIVDHPLTPVQQRNLEKELKAKVLDRTGIILEIFGERARTREGVLQVELAHLSYQKGRLVRSWTHLERQRGGAGFLGGPGETQIESDRRILQDKIVKLRRELKEVERTRHLHRSQRKKARYSVVAIVGYTNAGKSTLFNRLTGAGVMSEDMLFATLDPTLRRVKLPHGATAIFSDTVGFISDLPTHLVAAFRATLEEVVEADLIVHLRDISDPDTTSQAADVETILRDLGVETGPSGKVLEVWNKIDRLDDDIRSRLIEENLATGHGPAIAISAATGEGVEQLLSAIEQRLGGAIRTETVDLSPAQMGLIDWIYGRSTVLDRKDNDDGSVTLRIEGPEGSTAELLRRIRSRN